MFAVVLACLGCFVDDGSRVSTSTGTDPTDLTEVESTATESVSDTTEEGSTDEGSTDEGSTTVGTETDDTTGETTEESTDSDSEGTGESSTGGDIPCSSIDDCGPDTFCDFPTTICSPTPPGVCKPRPSGCPPGDENVYGCNCETYSSTCHAQADGVDVQINQAQCL